MQQPKIETSRLILRPLELNDASRIHDLINRPEIAEMTSHIPHPYPLELALSWISPQATYWNKQTGAVFGVELKSINTLIGVVSLQKLNENFPVLGFWLGTDYWGVGYTTEAAISICNFAFNTLNIKCISARHLERNPASGNVLKKIGFKCAYKSKLIINKNQKPETILNYTLTQGNFGESH